MLIWIRYIVNEYKYELEKRASIKFLQSVTVPLELDEIVKDRSKEKEFAAEYSEYSENM